MNTALSWIKAYVPDLDVTAQDYTDAMTLTGTEIESYTCLGRSLGKIVIGEILEVRGYSDADKLVVCQVNVGAEEPVQIATGAPNITERSIGEKVPVVLDGGHMTGGHSGGALPEEGVRIKQGKLRDVKSCGMMCSVEELGISRDTYLGAPENGIYVSPGDNVPGSDVVKIMGLRDVVFEYEITPNRVDCYNMIGIAGEVTATFGKTFHAPMVMPIGNGEDIHDCLNMRMENSELCLRYYARMVKNIKLVPSPQWMQRHLAGNDIRPINSIVGITNYVIEEYGQPIHTFDYDQLAGREIVVKHAKDGDVFQIPDGQKRKLDPIILMISDGEKGVGIADIMNGKNSRITDDVQTMVSESACFNGTNIRLSAKKVGLRMGASGKYEKGLDPNTVEETVNRACQLIEELEAGEVMGGVIDLYPEKRISKRIPFDTVKIDKLLGTDIPEETMLSYFKTIELDYDPGTKEVIAPTWHQDLERMVDLAEEVARFYDYDKILTALPFGETTTGELSYKLQIEEIARRVAEFCRFFQGMAYPSRGPKIFGRMLISEGSAPRKAVGISNPLGEDFSVMRTTSLNDILTFLSTNRNRCNKDVCLHEPANVYHPRSLPLTEFPDERMQLTLGMCGDDSFFIMEDVVEELFERAGMHKRPHYDPSVEHPYLHPKRKANILYDGVVVGFLGEVHPDVVDNYKIGDRAYTAVINMPSVMDFTAFDRKYTGIARFPAMTRGISMVVSKDTLMGQIEDMIKQRGGKVLESHKLFDVYEGTQALAGHKSVAYSIIFRAKDHTLGGKEVTSMMNKILNGLSGLGIELKV